MDSILIQIIIPFILSAIIVVTVTIIAERYGTKVGGILGTLPHLIIIAFVFIALNKDEEFASRAASVVPIEVGINIMFLFLFAHFSNRSLVTCLTISLAAWLACSVALVIIDFHDIYLSLVAFGACWITAVILFERVKGIGSVAQVKVEYTWKKLIARGSLAGVVIAFAVVMSNVGSVLSGIFSVFPAMFLSTMIISHREHGPKFVSGLAKSMIFGTPSVTSYAVGVHFLYPEVGIIWGTLTSAVIAIVIGLSLLALKGKIS